MTALEHSRASPARKQAVLFALRCYGSQMARLWRFTVPAMLLPALGNTGISYVAPLIVAELVGRFAGRGPTGISMAMPYVLSFAGVLLVSEILWRIGIHSLNRLDGRGIESLYIVGMDELLAKDAAFFHDNFAGSLTKRVLSFASRFEDFADSLAFNVVSSVVPLAFASVVLWRFDPLLVAGLIGMILITGVGVTPLIRRRQKLVDQREEAIARVSGHVADSLANMDTIRAFAAEDREAAEHKSRVAEQRRKSLLSWDYANLRVDALIAPMSVLTNVFGLLLAVALGAGGHGIEAIIVAFTYYSNATQVMFQFNQIYRQMESSLTEAAQFTELLLTPPTVLDPVAPEPLRPAAHDVRFENVSFAHAGGRPLFTGLDLTVPSGTKLGLVGRSGGGKTTLTRLLLRMMDVDEGRILIGGQDISRLCQADLRSLIAYVPQDPAMFHRTLRDNIAFARPGATDAEIHRGTGRARDRVHRRPSRRIRHDGRRARREAVRRAAAASRAGPGDPARRADPAARRGHQRAGLRERGPGPAGALAAHGEPDRARGRAPAEHGCAHGPTDRARPRPDRRKGHARGAAQPQRNLRQAVATPVWRLAGRQHNDTSARRAPKLSA